MSLLLNTTLREDIFEQLSGRPFVNLLNASKNTVGHAEDFVRAPCETQIKVSWTDYRSGENLTTPAPDDARALYLVLDALRPALKSVDFRCIAVTRPSEKYWQNLVTSVSFSDKTQEEVKAEQERIPKIRNRFFRLFCGAGSFSYHVLENIAKGELRIPEARIGRHRIQFRKSDPFGLKVMSSQEWLEGSSRRMLRAVDSGLEEERKELWSIVDKQSILPKQSGFDSIPKMIEHYLEIKYNNKDRKDIEIVICPPATIENLEFRGSSLEVILKKTSRLKGLQLNLRAMRRAEIVWRDTGKIESEKTEFRNSPEVFDIQELSPFDILYAELIHRDSGLTLDEKHREVPIKNVAEPLLKTLDSFCSLEEFEKMLFEPEQKKRAQDVFEDAVAWLLSLAGFNVIRLRLGRKSFDKLRVGERYQEGGADIIAYEENGRILLIECTTKSADEKTIYKLADTKKYFRKELEGYGKLPIVAILFSPSDFRTSSPSADVMIAHRSVIERVFQAIVRGNRDEARSLLHYSGF